MVVDPSLEPETEVGGRVPPAAARTLARAARTLARAAREAAAATAPSPPAAAAPSPRAGGGSTDGRRLHGRAGGGEDLGEGGSGEQ